MPNKAIYFIIMMLISVIIKPGNIKAQEIQVPVCDGIQVITSSMADGLDFFTAYPEFQQATVYKASDNTLVMEIFYKQDGSIAKARKTMSREEIDQVCTQMKAKMTAQLNDDIDPDRDGRRKIIGATMAYSLGYYAWAIPVAFETKSANSYIGSYLIIGSAGYFVPMLATQNSIITKGMAKGYTFGCFLGIGHGLALGSLVNGGTNSNSSFAISVLASVGEGLGGLYYARNHQLSRAYMRTMGSMGTWGTFIGLGIPAMAESRDNNVYAGSALAASVLGIYAGDQLAKKFKPTDGDITVINGMGIIGGFLPPCLVNTIAGNDGSAAAYIGSSILGSLAGITLGFRKTSKINYSRSEGNIILLGEFAGGLIGAGAAVLTEADDPFAAWFIGAGLLGGFLASDYVTLSKKKKDNTMGANLSFDFNPLAFQKIIKKESSRPEPGKPFLNGDLAKITLHF